MRANAIRVALAFAVGLAAVVATAAEPRTSTDDDDLLDVPLMMSSMPSSFDSKFVAQSFPASALRFNTPYTVTLTFRNTGTKVWQAGEVKLASMGNGNLKPSWGIGIEGDREEIYPGNDFTFRFITEATCNLIAPSVCQQVSFQWRLQRLVSRSGTYQYEYFGEASPLLVGLFDTGSSGDGSGEGTPAIEPGMIDLPVPGGPPPSQVPTVNPPRNWEDF
ncbi:hypothetical protein ACTHR6_25550 [Ralstonia holmesii]|uniref:Uncharacterized protein n=1 Tax=Ralstonia holmesii TaxID=3058602 RepID=A0ABC8QJG3_9RALS|nr:MULTISPECIES: hypothetical protein [Ralstonia]CAJ0704168.1 hypothetical protein R11007_04259 [Ralstonia sp. LMG 32967]CAJ0806956.1 hypothetical protein LMG18096_04881 [Ralstonia sp. LMG 32967]CAJ0821490.1 hypothetical protein LMG18093_04719 [Ralstonia sp. LMG 32967]